MDRSRESCDRLEEVARSLFAAECLKDMDLSCESDDCLEEVARSLFAAQGADMECTLFAVQGGGEMERSLFTAECLGEMECFLFAAECLEEVACTLLKAEGVGEMERFLLADEVLEELATRLCIGGFSWSSGHWAFFTSGSLRLHESFRFSLAQQGSSWFRAWAVLIPH